MGHPSVSSPSALWLCPSPTLGEVDLLGGHWHMSRRDGRYCVFPPATARGLPLQAPAATALWPGPWSEHLGSRLSMEPSPGQPQKRAKAQVIIRSCWILGVSCYTTVADEYTLSTKALTDRLRQRAPGRWPSSPKTPEVTQRCFKKFVDNLQVSYQTLRNPFFFLPKDSCSVNF